MKPDGCKNIRIALGTTFDTAVKGILKYMDDHKKIDIWEASLILAYQFPDLDKKDTLDCLIRHRSKK